MMMKMMMFLLVSAVTLLLSPAAAGPTRHTPADNLNRIIDLAAKYNKSVTEEFFVEDVSLLVEDGCEDKFFCKVYDILHKHEHFGKRVAEKELVRNLNMFILGRNANCTELLNKVPLSGTTRPIPKLVEYLKSCIQNINLSGDNKRKA